VVGNRGCEAGLNRAAARASRSAFGRTRAFSPIAPRYDATRDLPEHILLACYDRLTELGFFPAYRTILDAGCGTGQLSLPLAGRGYEVSGIDVSAEMIKLARSKRRRDWLTSYCVADARDMPLADGSIAACVVSKLFQHIDDWKLACRELIRVVRPGSYIIQINERGSFGNSIRLYFARRAAQLGFMVRHLGLNPHSNHEIVSFMADEGCQFVPVEMSDLQWDTRITFGQAINRIQERLYAEFWDLPTVVYDRLVEDTVAWIEMQPKGREAVEPLRPRLAVEVFRTPIRVTWR
jgi:ubiquinone/menaquinone biosynthesis C-methylase UbiE